VNINGATIERASLHNISVAKSLGLKRYGQTVYVYLANLIIPQIDHADDDFKEGSFISVPSTCPICGGMAVVEKNNDTEVLKCINPNCKGKLLGKLTHFVSKNAINIDGLSEATIEKFIELGWLNNFKDIYSLKDYKNKMYSLDGFGEKSVNKLLENIEKSRDTELSRFLAALSIPLIGKTASKEISKMCDGSYDKFITLINLNINEFSKIDGFGDVMLESLKTWWKENNEDICLLSKEFNFIENNTMSANSSSLLKDMTFCITGSLEYYKNRDELKELIESMGGKVTGSVTSKTTYLINNDTNSTSSKNKKARELSIPILNEKEFEKLLS
ncbi:MAG: hypothetical protein KBS35_00155, partial [Mycoplasma sp.]|nr:hypothetical protein [Candidatus Hennigella equi]